MQLEYLNYFLTVANEGSISKAADKLYLKQGNLSKVIKLIEEEFHTTLFERTKKGVTLTVQGEDVYSWAQNVMNQKENIIRQFSNTAETLQTLQGSVTIYGSPSIFGNLYTNFINKFLTLNPYITLKLVETDASTAINGIIDQMNTAAFVSVSENTLHTILENVHLTFYELKKLKPVILASKDSSYAKKYDSLSLKTLKTLPLISYVPPGVQFPPIKEILGDEKEFNIACEVSNLINFHSILNTGKYVAVGAKHQSTLFDNYVSIPIRDCSNLVFGVIINTAETENPLLKEFINSCFNTFHK